MGGRSSSFGKKAGGGAKLDLPELEGSEKQIKWAKVMGYFPWSWWLVFTPALAYVVLALILLIVLLIAALFYKDE